MKKPETKRVALYARVSLKDKERDKAKQEKARKQDTENQLRQLREFSGKQEGWEVVAEYPDYETGSGLKKRPQFEQMFRDASERKFDLLLFWSLDRLSREGTYKTMQHLERLKSNGVDWWSLKEEYLRTIGPFADAVLSILATLAKMERLRISERTKAGLERVRDEGIVLGRPSVEDKKGFSVTKARAMRDQGMSLREIATAMEVSPATVLHRLAGQVQKSSTNGKAVKQETKPVTKARASAKTLW
jgi:DNA invertase Pin-like site-specific DNA recombinase